MATPNEWDVVAATYEATIEKITGATYRKYEGKESFQSAPSGIPQHMANWDKKRNRMSIR